MKPSIRVVQFGLGPIGCSVVCLAFKRSNIEIVGAVDIAAHKAGKDLGEIAGLKKELGITVSKDIASFLKEGPLDVVLHCTGSNLHGVYKQLKQIISAGIDVVSTCEELSFPTPKNQALSESLHRLAVENNATILGTGINPGFLMDAWPLFMTGICQEITMIKATRIQDAASRRVPFQQKIGAGCSSEEFQRRVEKGIIRHVGLSESISMIASGLGWELDRISERIDPILSEKKVKSEYITLEAGRVAGVKQTACGFQHGRSRIILEFQAYLGATESYDEVHISGIPEFKVRIPGGIHGDIGTAAIVVNAAQRVIEAPAGLLTMKDIPPIVCTAG
jgi:hypothetical protein